MSGAICVGDRDGGAADRARLERLLGGGDLDWLLAKVRRRLELGQELVGAATLRDASGEQRAAVARLFGNPPRPGTTATVRLEQLDAVLRTSGAWPSGLESAVVALTGPCVVRAEALEASRVAWDAAWSPVAQALVEHPRGDLRDALRQWWQRELASGGARRAGSTPEAATDLARDLAAVLARLPAPGVAIGVLAHEATGSAHALDRGPLPGLVLRAARAVAGLPPPLTRTAEVDRETWAAVGVVRDETSSAVLTLGLPAAPSGATGRALAAWRDVGQPVVLTLRHLRLDPPRWEPPSGGGVVWVVENPVVLTAVADRLVEAGGGAGRGAGVPCPVVCTAGWPSAAAVDVMRGLRAAGWRLRHHGDLDPDGLAITEWLLREVGAEPWRMGAADYRRATGAGRGRTVAAAEVARLAAVRASWDAELGPALAQAQQVVEEEAVLDDLVADVVAG